MLAHHSANQIISAFHEQQPLEQEAFVHTTRAELTSPPVIHQSAVESPIKRTGNGPYQDKREELYEVDKEAADDEDHGAVCQSQHFERHFEANSKILDFD